MIRWKLQCATVLLTIYTCVFQFKVTFSAETEYSGKNIVEINRPFTIECHLSTFSFPKWTKDGIPLHPEDDDDYTLSEKKEGNSLIMTLHVEKARPHHAGEYRCNSFSREAHRIALLHDDDEDFNDFDDDEHSSSIVLKLNGTVRITCKLPKEDKFPVLWFKNNYRLLPGQDPRITIKGRSLTLNKAKETDAGEYMCTSTDVSSLSKPAVSSPRDVIGHITSVKYPAEVEPFSSPISLKAGNDLFLECSVHGSPIPRITWYIGNIPASLLEESDERITLLPNEKGLPKAILHIANLTIEDRSLYTCRARNSLNEDETSIFVGIRESVIKTNEPEPGAGIILEPGKTLVLQCNLTEGVNELQLSWLKDGQPISIDKDIIEDPLNHTITIKAANEKNHTGKYVCVAHNHLSSYSANATIQVTTRPGVKQFHKSMNLVQGDKLVLKCEFTGIPLPEIVWFVDGVENNGTDDHVSITTDQLLKTSILKIDELEYEDRAEYSCTARIGEDLANTTILIRVKDRLAALWPFLGICAEVAILCTIIFVYEKKRSKPEFEEIDHDQAAENKTMQEQKEGSQDVRQRK